MKNLLIIIISIFLLSCSTQKNVEYKPNNFKIWNINSYSVDGKELIPEFLNQGLFIFDEVNSRYYIQLTLSIKELERQKEYWQSIDKDVDITKLLLQIEVAFNIEEGSYTITKSDINYLLKGNKSEILDKKLENIIYSRKIKQSRGLIPFLIEKSKPNIEQQLPFPKIEIGEIFTLSSSNGSMTLKSSSSSLLLDFFGEHKLIYNK